MTIEDRLREAFASKAARVHPSGDAWTSLVRQLQRHRRRMAVLRPVAILSVVVLFSATLVTLWSAFRPVSESADETRTAGVSPTIDESAPPELVPRLTARIPLPGPPHAVAVGEGAIWVAVTEDAESSLLRIDPATNTVSGSIRLDGTIMMRDPVGIFDSSGIAVAHGSVWVATSREEGPALERVDPRTMQVTSTVSFGTLEHLLSMAPAEEGLWVAVDHEGATGSLVLVDPATNEIATTITLEGLRTGFVGDLAVGEGAVWVLYYEFADATFDGSTVLRIDPSTGIVTATIPAQGAITFVVGEGGVWIRALGPELAWLDPDTGNLQPISPGLENAVFFDSGLGGAWLYGQDPVTKEAVVGRVDGETRTLDQQLSLPRVRSADAALDELGLAVWLADSGNAIIRIDL
jgi:hypothetical protein